MISKVKVEKKIVFVFKGLLFGEKFLPEIRCWLKYVKLALSDDGY